MFADEIPNAIQWHEGMLLAPQHFQQSACRQEMLTQYSTLLAGPYCWGVRRLAFDGKLLPAGTVRVLDLEAVMPDGSVVAHRHSEKQELMLQLAADAHSRQRDIAVYLTVPARNSAGMKGALARYDAIESDPVSDENTGEDALRMPVLRPRLALMAGDTPPPKFVSMPIGKFRFEDEACVQTNFIAPSLAATPHSALGEMCGELASRVREKAIFISEQLRAPSAVSDKPLMLENVGRMQSLVSCLPLFEALLATGNSHPFPLYLTICSMIGNMAALGSGVLPPVFAPYNHADPRSSFEEVIGFALRMVTEGIPETYASHPFHLQDRVFHLMFAPEWATHNLVLAMRLPAGATEKEVIAWGEKCLIGSDSVLPSIRDRRIRGAQRQFVEKYQDLVPVRGVVLFSLRADSEFIKPGENLQILNFGEKGRAFSPLEIVLYVKRTV